MGKTDVPLSQDPTNNLNIKYFDHHSNDKFTCSSVICSATWKLDFNDSEMREGGREGGSE